MTIFGSQQPTSHVLSRTDLGIEGIGRFADARWIARSPDPAAGNGLVWLLAKRWKMTSSKLL